MRELSAKLEEAKARRLTLTFDCTDTTQKLVYDMLKTAGYGKRAPLVVKAMCQMMGTSVADEEAVQGKTTLEESVCDALDRLIQEAVENSVRKCMPLLAAGVTERLTESETAGQIKTGDERREEMPESMLQDALRMAELFG